MKIETQCLHEGYKPGSGEPRALPIYQSTTFVYDSTEHIGKLFDLEEAGHFYTRLSNPTVELVEKKIAALEGGVGAMCTSSGQAATLLTFLTILGAGDNILSTSSIYGGTFNLLGVTFGKMGIETTFFDQDMSEDEISALVKPNTKALFGETLANPAMSVLDFEKLARVAKKHGIPFIVDNTFATPILCRPFELGADIVVHSSSKYLDGHAVQLGGVIVDGGTFDWTNGKFPEFTEPDESYHGVVYTETFGKAAFITKARTQMMRDLGPMPPASAAFLLNLGLETLSVRIERHCRNAERTAEFLERHPKVESVNYPALEGNKYHMLAKKYLPNGCCGVITFVVKGGRDNAVRLMDSLKLASNMVHVCDVKTCVLHPASATHRQMTDRQLTEAGIQPGMIRLSVGIEHIDDILEDLEQALAQIPAK